MGWGTRWRSTRSVEKSSQTASRKAVSTSRQPPERISSPIFLPEWPALPPNGGGAAPYTTVAHWWGGTFEFNGTTFSNEKRASFLEYLDLPTRTTVPLELAVCLAEHYEEYRALLAPKGWRLREAWDVSSTPEQYRA